MEMIIDNKQSNDKMSLLLKLQLQHLLLIDIYSWCLSGHYWHPNKEARLVNEQCDEPLFEQKLS